MGILSNIFHKIFPAEHPALVRVAQGTTVPPAATPAAEASAAPAAAAAVPPATSAASTAISEVDVESILNAKAEQADHPLNWRTSIVDLLKLLDLDSSFQSRKELATELHYTGDTNDSASMNVWLQHQVLNELAENGGKVPTDLED
jgi:hypothetical protein